MIKLIPLIFFQEDQQEHFDPFSWSNWSFDHKNDRFDQKTNDQIPNHVIVPVMMNKVVEAGSGFGCFCTTLPVVDPDECFPPPNPSPHPTWVCSTYIVIYTGKVGWCSVVGTLLLRVARQFITIAKALFKLSCSPNS